MQRLAMVLALLALFAGRAGADSVELSRYLPLFDYPRAEFQVSLRPSQRQHSCTVTPLSFTSRVTTGYERNDTVYALYYQPLTVGRHPAVVMLHGWGTKTGDLEQQLCGALAARGIAAVFLTLPFHLERTPPGHRSGDLILSSDLKLTVLAVRQAIVDARTLADWLSTRPEVDSQRLGVVGISLGAILANLVMGVDERFSVGVSVLGGGDLAGIIWHGLFGLPLRVALERGGVTRQQAEETLLPIEPITYAGRNRPRKVLMINGLNDEVIPRANAETLWRALDKPPITWVACGHFGLLLVKREVFSVSLRYLRAEFGMSPSTGPLGISVPALKLGLLEDPRLGLRPSLEVSLVPIGHGRGSLDLALTSRGLFAGAAARLRSYLSLGVGCPIGRGAPRPTPYLSLHLTL